jgi:hypothetical protein
LSDKESTVLFPGTEKEDFLFSFLQRYSGLKIFHRIEIPTEEEEIRKNAQIHKQLNSDFKFPIVVVNKYFVTLFTQLMPINIHSETNTDTETESKTKSDFEEATEQLNNAEEIVSDIILNVLRIESKLTIKKIILFDNKQSKLSKLSNSQTVKLSKQETTEVLVLPFDSEISEDFFSNKNGEEEISQRDYEALVATFNILTSTEDEEEEVDDDDQSPYAGKLFYYQSNIT